MSDYFIIIVKAIFLIAVARAGENHILLHFMALPSLFIALFRFRICCLFCMLSSVEGGGITVSRKSVRQFTGFFCHGFHDQEGS